MRSEIYIIMQIFHLDHLIIAICDAIKKRRPKYSC